MKRLIAILALLPAAAAADGAAVYRQWCSHCHDPGLHHPGTNALTAKYGGDPSGVLRERDDLSPDIIRYFVRHGVSVMPMFRKTEISDAELDALAEYLRAPKP